MALVLEILLGAMILASFFVAYMSARTWPIYQAVLVAFLFLGSVGLFYMSARTLRTHQSWGTLVKKMESDLTKAEVDTRQLVEGGGQDAEGKPALGVKQLRKQLAQMAFDRGGAIFDVGVGPKDGGVQLTLKSPDHGLVPNTVLFAFDQNAASDGGRYQGEFKVTAVDGAAVDLAPNFPLTKAQAQRLTSAEGPWTLYTAMPIDDPAVNAVAGADASRSLRDYEQAFHTGYVQRELLTDSISKLNSNLERTTAAGKSTADEIAFREAEITALTADLDRFQFERNAIAAYQQTLERHLTAVRATLVTTYAHNREMAGLLTGRQ